MNLFVSLGYLVALDEHKHFGRAADACNITQPALSNALKALEDSYGISIISRGQNFIGFTPEGELVLAMARRVLLEQRSLQQEISTTASNPRGNLYLGAVPSAIPVAARFAAMIQTKHKEVFVQIKSLSSQELETGVEHGTLDMALGYTERIKVTQRLLTTVHQYNEKFYLVKQTEQSSSKIIQKAAPISWNDATKLPLCLLSKEMHNRSIIDHTFELVGAVPHTVIETNSISALGLASIAEHVCSIMPGALVGNLTKELSIKAHPLVEPQIEIAIAWILLNNERRSHVQNMALTFAQSQEWRAYLKKYSGSLDF